MVHQDYTIDIGSFKFSIGYAGDANPSLTVPPVVGYEFSIGGAREAIYGDVVLGEDGENLDVSRLVSRGVIKDYEGIMSMISSLGTNYDKGSSAEMDMSTDSIVASMNTFVDDRKQAGKLMQVAFEKANLGSFYANDQTFFSMTDARSTTGTVLEVGHSGIALVPFVNSLILRDYVLTEELGGQDITEYFNYMIEKRENKVVPLTELTISQAKAAITFTALNYATERLSTKSKKFEAPDGTWVDVSDDIRVSAPEVLFNPSLYEKTAHKKSLPQLIKDYRASLRSVEGISSIGTAQLSNILLSGGASLSKNFEYRLAEEVPEDMLIQALPQRDLSAWRGASVIGVLESFHCMAITKKEYEELGWEKCVQKMESCYKK